MKRLGNGGWGLSAMIGFMIAFVVLLIVVVIMSYKVESIIH